jgi:hypothetical protein
MRIVPALVLSLFLPASAFAQAGATGAAASPPPTVATSLPQLQQVIANTRVDLAELRVDKWKTDSGAKEQARRNIEALERNMTSALPEMIAAVQANPASLAASFRLYRNLNVLSDVLVSVAESAGAFGSKDEYRGLAADVQNLNAVRRGIAEQVEALATTKDAQLARLEAQVRRSAAAAVAPPKKVIVDDTEPAKKPPKKKPAPKKP